MNRSGGFGRDSFFYLVPIYCFIICFGNLFRFGSNESAIGLSTVIIIIIIISSPLRSIQGIESSSILKSIFFLLIISLFSAFFYPGDVFLPIKGTGQIFLYLLLAGVATQVSVNEKGMRNICFGIAFGLFLSSLITILDFLKVYDFPYVNETKLISNYGGVQAEQAGGFFNRRSAMAAYWSLFIPMIIIVGFDLHKGLLRILMFLAAGVAFISLFLTHNRSGIVGVCITFVIFIIFNKNYSKKRKLQFGFLLSFLVLSVSAILHTYFPEHVAIYMQKLGITDGVNYSTKGERLSESDISRIFFFIEAFKSMFSSPIGHGFALMHTKEYGYLDTHNIISHIIWATGGCGIIWLVYTYFSFRKLFKDKIVDHEMAPYFEGIKYGLLSWFLNNMAHNNISMGIVWILLGILITVNKKRRSSIVNTI